MEILHFKQLTRIEQTLFGLPMLAAGALLPFLYGSWSFSPLWLLLPFIFMAARVSGMAFNQWLDWHYDQKNSRTAERVIPSGLVSPKQAAWIAIGSLVLFIGLSSLLGWRFFLIALPIGFLIATYSLLKRFTFLCHFVIGAILGLGPLMGWVVVTGQWALPPLLLAIATFGLIAGNDILYAIQDIEFDRSMHLHSIPAVFGSRTSYKIAYTLHLLMLGSLFFLATQGPSSLFVAFILSALLFRRHHKKVVKALRKGELEKINRLFFLSNFLTSLAIFSVIFYGVVWAALS